MADARTSQVVAALLERHGRTYAAEAGIDVRRGTPSPLFRLLCLSLLLSARIRADAAVAASRALADRGWTTPKRMAESTWRERTDTLNRAGYARYDESTSRMVGETTQLLLRRYGGDLRALRDAARRDPAAERQLLGEFKGIGNVGVNIFFREVQLVWDEVAPFADERMLESAECLRLPSSAAGLRKLVPNMSMYTRLSAALVRARLAKDHDDILAAAA